MWLWLAGFSPWFFAPGPDILMLARKNVYNFAAHFFPARSQRTMPAKIKNVSSGWPGPGFIFHVGHSIVHETHAKGWGFELYLGR